MSETGSGPRRPQPVSVEEWDDDTQDSVPGTRITANQSSANVAVKRDFSADSHLPSSLGGKKNDGIDSGYASKAPTVSSMASSPRRRNSELKIDTTVQVGRESRPYAMTAAPVVATTATRPTVVRRTTVERKEEPKPVKKPFCHQKGICWVCDKYDFHFDPKNPPESVRRQLQAKTTAPTLASAASKQQPNTQTKVVAVAKPKIEERPASRRQSSATQPRPTMMYAGTPVQVGPYPQYPMPGPGPGWVPGMPPMQVAYTQVPYMAPGTPVNYMPPQDYYYQAPPVFEEYQQRPQQQRRISMISQERPALERRPSRQNTLERTVSRDQRPQMTSHKSNRSINADKVAMPPPPRPQPVQERPRQHRASTYEPPRQQSAVYDDDSSSESSSDGEYDARALARQPPASPRRPPSSYKAPQEERPPLRTKSQSYNEGSQQTHVSKSREVPRRRTTESVPVVDKEEAAEAYMRKRGSTGVDLTAENLKTLKQVVTRKQHDQHSESGSTASHVTHQSSKDSSTGRSRTRNSMNININGLNLNIEGRQDDTPVRLDVAGVQISMNNKENLDYYKRPQKQLERTPSMSSRPSRRSLTQSLVSTATANRQNEILAIEARERRPSLLDDEQREQLRAMSARASRRSSQLLDDEEREKLRMISAKSSRQPSRVRAESRNSIDYSL